MAIADRAAVGSDERVKFPQSFPNQLDAFLRSAPLPEAEALRARPELPRVSVVIPSFQQAQFLERTLRSVILQAYPNLEIIVMDGGSQDGSREIIASYAKYLTYWQSEPDGGQSAAINAGMRRATGEILAYLNSDDVYLPTHPIEHAVQALQLCDVAHGHVYLLDPDDTIFGVGVALPYSVGTFLAGVCGLQQPASFWRRRVFEATGGFDVENRSWMDGEFFLRAAELGLTFQVVDVPLAGFRLYPSSITGSGRFRGEYQQGLAKAKGRFKEQSAALATAHRAVARGRRAVVGGRLFLDLLWSQGATKRAAR